jgi:hypothetical protein
MTPRAGTVLATPCDAGGGGRLSRITLLSLVWFAVGCVVLPDVADPVTPETALITIDRVAIDPALVKSGTVVDKFDFDPILDTLVSFDATPPAVTSKRLSSPVQYSWFYDYRAGDLPTAFFARCGNSPKCPIAVCSELNANSTDLTHTLLLVVSDRPQRADATGPLDFDDGAVFDWVQWKIELTQACK